MNTTLNVFLNQGDLWSRVLSLAPDTVKNIATADKLKVSSIFKHGNKTVFDKVLLLSDAELASDIVLTYGDKWNSLITAELDKLDITMLDGRMVTEKVTYTNTKTGSVDNENKVSAFNSDVLVTSDGTHSSNTDTDDGTKTRTLSDGNVGLNNLLNNLSLLQQTNIINVVINDVVNHITLSVY